VLKRVAESVLAGALANDGRLRRRRGRVLVLAFHNIIKSGNMPIGDRSLHLPFDRFRQHLDILEACFDLVGLESLLAPSSSTCTRDRIVVTFDDAYAGALTYGIPELVRRGIPATIFVAPALLNGARFWWDRLATGEGLAAKIRQVALESYRGRDRDVLTWATGAGLVAHDLPEEYGGASDELLASSMRGKGITVGGHSWSHPNLAQLSPADVHEEMHRSNEWIREHFPEQYVPAVAYPYGMYNASVDRIARAEGFRLRFRVDGGWMLDADVTEETALSRFNVPAGLSAQGLRLRLSGLMKA
jgi:peptidoglycan/xylan/chitin deacetylase (PgdA/CDA1 family)